MDDANFGGTLRAAESAFGSGHLFRVFYIISIIVDKKQIKAKEIESNYYSSEFSEKSSFCGRSQFTQGQTNHAPSGEHREVNYGVFDWLYILESDQTDRITDSDAICDCFSLRVYSGFRMIISCSAPLLVAFLHYGKLVTNRIYMAISRN